MSGEKRQLRARKAVGRRARRGAGVIDNALKRDHSHASMQHRPPTSRLPAAGQLWRAGGGGGG
jgi:hypothetical protein